MVETNQSINTDDCLHMQTVLTEVQMVYTFSMTLTGRRLGSSREGVSNLIDLRASAERSRFNSWKCMRDKCLRSNHNNLKAIYTYGANIILAMKIIWNLGVSVLKSTHQYHITTLIGKCCVKNIHINLHRKEKKKEHHKIL